MASPFESVVRALLTPVNVVLHGLSTTLRPGREQHVDDAPIEDYELALQYIRKLEVERDDLAERLARLTESQVEGVRQIEARVTAFLGDADNPMLAIDRGENRGVKNNLAVVYGANLVGTVAEAGNLTADVALTTAPGTNMEVRVMPAEPVAAREVRERLIKADDGDLFYMDVAATAPVQVGDLAHLSEIGVWPPEAAGFIVGQVIEAQDHPKDPLKLKRWIVRPMVDLKRLKRVSVLAPSE